ncbi:MAG TPA: hypothetical protein VKP11_05660 [Frankiaceae bacterium]|nr:hypothetical protein [Frankiaceae bacterium]
MTHDQMTHRDGRLSVAGVVLLAALGVPRAVLHDLHLLGTGPAAAILALAPPAIWLLVVLRRRISRPFRQLVLIGLTYGILLAAGHQLLWDEAWRGNPPELGGNLRGELPAAVESLVLRGASALGSIATGTAIGVLVGAIARAVQRRSRHPGRRA